MFKKDLKGSAACLVFGQTLRLPGDIFIRPKSTQTLASTDLVRDMRQFAASLRPTLTRVQTCAAKPAVFMPDTLEKCYHIFVRESPIKPNLSSAYSGPYIDVSRNAKVFTILKDTKIAINNVKPGFVPNNVTADSTSLTLPPPQLPPDEQGMFSTTSDNELTLPIEAHNEATSVFSPHPTSSPATSSTRRFPRRNIVLPSHLQDYEL